MILLEKKFGKNLKKLLTTKNERAMIKHVAKKYVLVHSDKDLSDFKSQKIKELKNKKSA